MKAVSAWLGRTFSRVEDVLAVLAAVLVGTVMILVTIAVISRYFVGNPMAWVLEVTEYALLFLTLMAAPWLMRKDEHVRVDLILCRLGPRGRALLDAWGSLLSAGAGFALVWYGLLTTHDHFQRNIVLVKMLEIPKFLLLGIIPFGLFLISLECLRRAYSQFTQYRSLSKAVGVAGEEPCVRPLHPEL